MLANALGVTLANKRFMIFDRQRQLHWLDLALHGLSGDQDRRGRQNRTGVLVPVGNREYAELATHDPEAMWIGGTYDTELVKENGEWKFKQVNLSIKLLTPYTEGWAKKQVRD